MNRAIVTRKCELCGIPRTSKYMGVGLICRTCYLENAKAPRPIKQATALIRQTYENERMEDFLHEQRSHND